MSDAKPSTFGSLLSDIEENADRMRELIMAQIAEYASKTPDESDWILTCASAVKTIDSHKTALRKITGDLIDISENVLGFNSDSETTRAGRRRKIEIEVTEGMLRQNLLNLTSAKQRGVVRLGERFHIQLPNGNSFETQLVNPGNKLRERGRIREFYEVAKIRAGDFVVLEEISKGTWALRPRTDEANFDIASLELPNPPPQNAQEAVKQTITPRISLHQDWTSRRPSGYQLRGESHKGLPTWSSVFEHLLRALQTLQPEVFSTLPDRSDLISSQGHCYFSHTGGALRTALRVTDDVFAETNLSANLIRDIIRRTITIFGIKESEIEFYLRK